ncbi:MAG: RNA-binding S4 domain-containing protein [Bryobacteraceae bacterium]|nr:RNA-binding S4 domain-containing protein [Bryobacteraceae bacterium]
MDKWLWAARFFKTRSLASKACELGRIESNGHRAKAAREVRIGDRLVIRNDAGEFQVEVLAVSEIRGPAAVAAGLYNESEASREARLLAAQQRKADLNSGLVSDGRPTKRDRRMLSRLQSVIG